MIDRKLLAWQILCIILGVYLLWYSYNFKNNVEETVKMLCNTSQPVNMRMIDNSIGNDMLKDIIGNDSSIGNSIGKNEESIGNAT